MNVIDRYIAPLATDEARRLGVVAEVRRLSSSDATLQSLVQVAAEVLQAPIALLTLVDNREQVFLASFGVDIDRTDRDISFCAHAILEPDQPMIVPDASRDPVLAGNPMVSGEAGVRFYAGVPMTIDDQAVGSFCVVDTVARTFSASQVRVLGLIAEAAQHHLASRMAGTVLA